MRKIGVLLVGTLTAVMAVASTPMAGQAPRAAEGKAATTKTAATKTWSPPRTAWGDPDLQGIWRNFTVSLNGSALDRLGSMWTLSSADERPKQYEGREFLTDEEVAAIERQAKKGAEERLSGDNETFDVQGLPSYNAVWGANADPVRVSRRTSAIIDPPNGRLPPWTAEQLKRWKAREALARDRGEGDSWEDRGFMERCLRSVTTGLDGVKEIVQGPGYVAIATEGAYSYRIIPLDGRPAPGPKIRQWLGEARGHWEGNTLVVEIANFNDKQDGGPIIPSSRNLRDNYAGSGERLRLIERFTPLDPQTLEYRYTIDDPQTYTRPYTVVHELTRDDRYVVLPSQCYEGNDGLAGILAAARADEKGALETAALFRRERQIRLEQLKAEWASWQKQSR